jgi:hypothetical protein
MVNKYFVSKSKGSIQSYVKRIYMVGSYVHTCKCSGLASQCCDVVLVGAHLARENPRGSGFQNGEGMGRDGNGEISLRATWDQGGRILSQQGGFQVSKGE